MRLTEPEARRFEARSTTLNYYDWGGGADGPLVLLLHATGFHGRVWDATVRLLPPGFRVLAVDQRGHGRSAPCAPVRDWGEAAADIAELAAYLGLRGVIGCGHSKGGHLTARVELLRPGTYAGMVLCDPVLPPPHAYGPVDPELLEHPDRHPVAQRRNRYADWRDFHAHLKDREPYSLWRPEILVDYCRHGVKPAADGDGVELACAPVTEASIYITSRQSSILDRLGGVACPVTVLRAKDVPEEPGGRLNFMRSTTWSGLAGLFPKGRDVYLPDLTHFIPMQAPDIVVRHIAETASTAAGDG